MGYTTTFTGKFKFSRPLNEKETELLRKFNDTRHGCGCHHYDGMPGFWCKWDCTADGQYLEWDGNEKFYNFTAWLQYLITNFFEPNGITLNGKVGVGGEDDDDNGVIEVVDNEITTYAQGVKGAKCVGDTEWSQPYTPEGAIYEPKSANDNLTHHADWCKAFASVNN